jgi:hypothetical protein
MISGSQVGFLGDTLKRLNRTVALRAVLVAQPRHQIDHGFSSGTQREIPQEQGRT